MNNNEAEATALYDGYNTQLECECIELKRKLDELKELQMERNVQEIKTVKNNDLLQ